MEEVRKELPPAGPWVPSFWGVSSASNQPSGEPSPSRRCPGCCSEPRHTSITGAGWRAENWTRPKLLSPGCLNLSEGSKVQLIALASAEWKRTPAFQLSSLDEHSGHSRSCHPGCAEQSGGRPLNTTERIPCTEKGKNRAWSRGQA